jgi:hypothetical protein
MADLAAAVPVDPDDIDGWLDRMLDHHAAHPELLRLLFWEGIAYGTADLPDYARKVGAIADAQERGVITDAIPAGDLLLLLVALASWASAVPQMRRIVSGAEDPDRERLRASVKEAARRLVAK